MAWLKFCLIRVILKVIAYVKLENVCWVLGENSQQRFLCGIYTQVRRVRNEQSVQKIPTDEISALVPKHGTAASFTL